ncbi:MAG TPA: PQQ-binding-like beta-propeller repeat protein, partial [Fimbriimonadaceae bacterium]|nr:PQQ-binding-like beta-propeller repeat protein [Fimbriimonadaceae bacterium]
MMRTRTLFVSLLAGVAAMAGAQWSQLHGNAQHNGYAGVPLPDSFQLAWETDLGGPIVSSPVTGPDGTIYVGPVREDTLETPSVAIYAVNPDGSVKWKFRTPFIEDETFTLPTPAVGPDGTIYIGALNGVFYALNPTGSVKWQKQGDYPVLQSAAVAPNGNVYVGLDGRLNAFSPAGTLLWQAPMGDPRLSGGPALATDGTIYSAYAQQDVEVKLVALNPNGSSKWEYPLSLYFWPLGAPVVGQDGSIYVT